MRKIITKIVFISSALFCLISCAPKHEHAYTKASDDTYHYEVCECGEVINKEEHKYEEKITKEATYTSDGEKTFTCSCGRTYKESFSLDQTTKDSITAVINKIKEIGSYKDSDDKIAAAKSAYNALSDTNKAFVPNADIISAAEVASSAYKSLDLTSLDTMKKALVNNAFAFYYKESAFQYDQYNSRRNPNALAEDANSEFWTNLDCSSFCNAVYNYTFNFDSSAYPSYDVNGRGANIIHYSGNYPSDINTANVNAYCKKYYLNSSYPDVVYYADTKTLTTRDAAKATEIRNMLQVGDLYTYRHGSAGHIMLYLGDIYGNGVDYFMHSTGAAGSSSITDPSVRTTEDQTNHEKKLGCLCLDKADIVFKESEATKGVGGTTNRYIFNSENTSWSILRPLTRFVNSKKYTLNDRSVARLIDKGLNIEKHNNVGNMKSVKKGDEITYTVTITNSDDYSVGYTFVEEVLPTNTTYVSCSNEGIYNAASNKITWQIAGINAYKQAQVSYTVKVSGDAGSKVTDFNTTVNGLKTNKIQNEVRGIDTDKVVNEVLSKVGSDASYLMTIINNAYNTCYGIDLKAQGILADSSGKLGDKTLCSYGYSANVLNSAAKFTSLVPSILYGGVDIRKENPSSNDNCRNLTSSMLEPGDIICTYDDYFADNNGGYTTYFYVDSSTIIGLSGGKVAKVYTTTTKVNEFLHTCAYYDKYIVVRPSICSLYK